MKKILWWIVAGYFQRIKRVLILFPTTTPNEYITSKNVSKMNTLSAKMCPAWPSYAWTHCTANTWDYLLIYFYSNFYCRSVWQAEIHCAMHHDLDSIILPPDWSVVLVNLNRQEFILQTYLILQKGCLMLKKEYESALKFVILDTS